MASALYPLRAYIDIFRELLQALGWEVCVAAPLFVMFGYVIFGMVGFGSTITNAPLLAHFLPLRFVTPLTMLLDMFAAIAVGTRMRGEADRGELKRILPFVMLGLVLGLVLLIKLPERALLLLLGCFVFYAGVSSLARRHRTARIHPAWAIPAGVAGGMFSALYGTGGPIYTIYFSRRIADISAFRATMAKLILIIGLVRIVLFAVSGLLWQDHLLLAAVLLAPFAAFGLFVGNRLHHGLSAKRILMFVYLLLIVNGAALVMRAW
ncbi:MAG: sulfite exporter TauE/SafE family protein [Burkholderiales bacterium]|nr:sulfite exporter TauE/SafE family protein [Burkholderiales bacterium]